jgi:FecR protein
LKRREFITHFAALCTSSCAAFWSLAARGQNPADQPAAGQDAGDIGQVATLKGTASVTRGNPAGTVALRVKDPIFKHDIVATDVNSTLGITFDDQTTFSLSASTRIVIDEFVYQEGASGNAATFNVAVGTAAFVASLVARTGDMRINTPSTTLGIRGTTGVVDVPPGGTGAAGGTGESRIKLYPDADGHVGQIDVFNRQGGRLGTLTEGASAFAIQRGPGGGFRAVPFQIPAAEAARDRGVLRRLFASHAIGRRMTTERVRARGGNRSGPNRTGPHNRQPGTRQPEHRQPEHRQPEHRQPEHQQQPSNRNPRQGGPPPGGGQRGAGRGGGSRGGGGRGKRQ